MRDRLLPLAVSEADFEAWRVARQARRRTELPAPSFIQLEGFSTSDEKRLNVLLARHVGAPLAVSAVEHDIAMTAGLDRYQTVTWRLIHEPARGYGFWGGGGPQTHPPPLPNR